MVHPIYILRYPLFVKVEDLEALLEGRTAVDELPEELVAVLVFVEVQVLVCQRQVEFVLDLHLF